MMKSKFGKNLKLFVVRREISKQSKNQLDNETSVLQLLLLHVIIMAGIRRFVERQQLDPRISLTSWLNMRSQNTVATTSELPESVVINIDNQFAILENDILRQNQSHYHHHHRATPIDNSVHIHNSATEVHNNTNSNAGEDSNNGLQLQPHARELLNYVLKFGPFIMVLLVKAIYDNRSEIFYVLLLLLISILANNELKREIAKQQNKSYMALLGILCYIGISIIFTDSMFSGRLLFPYDHPTTLWELLWSVCITDFVLKLITIVFKVLLTCLPATLLALPKRGKYYLAVEAASQTCRCIAPIPSWVNYLSEPYKGFEVASGVSWSIMYIISKGGDLLPRLKLLRTAVWKLFQNVNLGVSPSVEQLEAAGGICTICHEEFSIPVRLCCKHIFCEACVSIWLDRERSCPLCRTYVTDDPSYRDGHTFFAQWY
ncbi:RING finger and transmembrane domain-containing protein 2 isoform X2 [Orussus abietinus]|uniref:RING finger and transmembrane domain-containing protein 2 isoform X2 n=1 Tax=Orussus abietinus TaxID=222816 RepID=UPI0006255ABF|nr:RING finger and transmembrane domain-containing protein 2 isoform X2 [Orussus abietinus]